MKELQDGIERAIEDETGKGQIDLHIVSKKWATWSLDTYTGTLLSKALDISKAIADFSLELKEPGHDR